MKDINIYANRRTKLMNKINDLGGGIVIIYNSPKYQRNADIYYPYRHDSDFYYLTGFSEPNACLVLIVSDQYQRSILFCRSKDFIKDMWEGPVYGPNIAAKLFGFDEGYSIQELNKMIPNMVLNKKSIYAKLYSINNKNILQQIQFWIHTAKKENSSEITLPTSLCDISYLLSDMRLIKDHNEISIIRKSANIAASSHIHAMLNTKPGMHEYEIEAEITYQFRRQGASSIAYDSIIASGKNACTIHYSTGNSILCNGDLILVDAGCEFNSYASDITRTFPVNGKFNNVQLAFYEIVLSAQKAAIEKIIPGKKYNEAHEAAVKILAQGMLDEKLLTGSLDGIIESREYLKYYPHSTSHWLGLDVHDCGNYKKLSSKNENNFSTWRELKEGMVLTIEPGLYINPNQNIPKHFWNIGIRIEDTVIVTKTGYELITRDVPVEPYQIEDLMKR
ncbi:MAG: aminopeptidase P N-terminal domain-containing protein [Bordetella sp.]|nr:MAG: aminopeptidase P N-terminal domain-containing protein [Bordetella sp.]